MTKNEIKIRSGIRALAYMPYQISSGKVVAGSLDAVAGTVSVLQLAGGKAVGGVLLSAVTGVGNGMVLYPADGSDVVMGSMDGGGEWVLLQASVLTKATISIGDVVYAMDSNGVNIQNGSVVINVGAAVLKLNTASESLYALLNDLITYITELTVPTSGGASGVPINILDFSNLLARLSNLLGA